MANAPPTGTLLSSNEKETTETSLDPCTIDYILKQEQVPQKFLCRAQVIDHFPPDIADFCAAYCPECYKRLSPLSEDKCLDCHVSVTDQDYRFQFALLMKDDTQLFSIEVDSLNAVRIF
jgi:hypothetical protein